MTEPWKGESPALDVPSFSSVKQGSEFEHRNPREEELWIRAWAHTFSAVPSISGSSYYERVLSADLMLVTVNITELDGLMLWRGIKFNDGVEVLG